MSMPRTCSEQAEVEISAANLCLARFSGRRCGWSVRGLKRKGNRPAISCFQLLVELSCGVINSIIQQISMMAQVLSVLGSNGSYIWLTYFGRGDFTGTSRRKAAKWKPIVERHLE